MIAFWNEWKKYYIGLFIGFVIGAFYGYFLCSVVS